MTRQTERVQTLADVRAVIDGNDRLDYQFTDRQAAYEFIRRTLVRFDYPTLSKPDKGIIGRYLAKMTGLSRAQMTRLVGQHRATGRVTDRRGGAPVRPFERRYTGADIRRHPPALAEADAALGDMSGPATRAVRLRYPCIPFGWTVPRKHGAQSTRRARVGWNIFRQFAHRRRGRSSGSSRFPASPGWMPCPCCTTGQPLRPISRTRRDFTDR